MKKNQTEKPFILITNDDGIHAPGIAALVETVSVIADVIVVAPVSEKSAVGHAITLSDPLRVYKEKCFTGIPAFSVKGMPADCVKIAYWALLDRKPDMLISGINLGSNTGINTLYSGTVSAATEGAILGIPSFAISLTTFQDPDFGPAARFAVTMVKQLLVEQLPSGVYLNINVPAVPAVEIQGVQVTRQGEAMYHEVYDKRLDPHGGAYYWLSGQKVDIEKDLDVDEGAIQSKFIAITPIHFDLTHYHSIEKVKAWNISNTW